MSKAKPETGSRKRRSNAAAFRVRAIRVLGRGSDDDRMEVCFVARDMRRHAGTRGAITSTKFRDSSVVLGADRPHIAPSSGTIRGQKAITDGRPKTESEINAAGAAQVWKILKRLGVGGSTPSLATMFSSTYKRRKSQSCHTLSQKELRLLGVCLQHSPASRTRRFTKCRTVNP